MTPFSLQLDGPYAERAVLLASEEGVSFAQKMRVGPCTLVRIWLENAEVGLISGPTWRLSGCIMQSRHLTALGHPA